MKHIALCLLLSCTISAASSAADVQLTYKGKVIGPNFHKAIDCVRRSEALIKEHKFEEARVLLNRASILAPEYEEAGVLLGYVLLKCGKAQEAIKYLQAPVDNNTDNENVWLSLAEAYGNCGRTDDALLIYDCFMKRFPNSKYRSKIQSMKSAVQEEQSRISTALKEPDGSEMASVSDYFKEATSGTPRRWPQERMPLPVFINSGVGVHGWRSGLDTIARESFLKWGRALGRGLSFRFVEAPADAVVELNWVDDVAKFKSESERGETTIKGVGSTMVRAKMDILTMNSAGKPDSDERIALTCLHEIGHALGISGHSPNPSDVMYFSITSADKIGGLSERDINTLRKIYATGPLVSSKTEQMHAAGAAALDAGNFSKATQIFSDILKASPDLDSARINLALSLSGLALQLEQAKKYDEAEKAYEQVISLRKLVAQPELLTASLTNYAAMLRERGRLVEATNVEKLYKDAAE